MNKFNGQFDPTVVLQCKYGAKNIDVIIRAYHPEYTFVLINVLDVEKNKTLATLTHDRETGKINIDIEKKKYLHDKEFHQFIMSIFRYIRHTGYHNMQVVIKGEW